MAEIPYDGIKWQDKITNNDVLQRAKMDGIDRGEANEGTAEMGRPRAANECSSNTETNFLFRVVLRRQK